MHADGIAIVGGSPRAIGRAGAATVGDDGGGALLINPAAMARRDTTRAQLGVAVVEDAVQWQSDVEALGAVERPGRLAARAARRRDRRARRLGDRRRRDDRRGLRAVATASGRRIRRPWAPRTTTATPGSPGAYRRDTVAVGVARRIGDSLALGVSLGSSQVSVTEQRRIWAGFGGRDKIGDPAIDVDVRDRPRPTGSRRARSPA